MNAVLGNVVRPVGLTTFADITDAPLVLDAGRVDRNGLLFDGELTPEQVEAIWFRMTSRDTDDEAERRAIKALADDEPSHLLRCLAYRHLGLPLPPAPDLVVPEPLAVSRIASTTTTKQPSKSSKPAK